MKTDKVSARVPESVMTLWKIAAQVQGYGSFSDYVRDAIAEKTARTPEILKARKAELEALIAEHGGGSDEP